MPQTWVWKLVVLQKAAFHHATCWFTVLIYYSHLLSTALFIMQPVGSQCLFIIHTCCLLYSSCNLLVHSIYSLFTLVFHYSVHRTTCWFTVLNHYSHLLSTALFIVQPVGSQYLVMIHTCCLLLCSSCNPLVHSTYSLCALVVHHCVHRAMFAEGDAEWGPCFLPRTEWKKCAGMWIIATEHWVPGGELWICSSLLFFCCSVLGCFVVVVFWGELCS